MRKDITEPLSTIDFIKGGNRHLNLSGLSDVQDMKKALLKAKFEKRSDLIEKGAISEALDGYSSAFRDKNFFEKTGKEIKDKIDSLVTSIKAKKSSLLTAMTVLEKEIGVAPNQEPDEYELREFPDDSELVKLIKRYDYNMCYYNNGSNSNTDCSTSSENAKAVTCADSLEQAKLCQAYNNAVYQVKDCVKDLKNAHVFINNLKEGENYKLTLSDLKNLGF